MQISHLLLYFEPTQRHNSHHLVENSAFSSTTSVDARKSECGEGTNTVCSNDLELSQMMMMMMMTMLTDRVKSIIFHIATFLGSPE